MQIKQIEGELTDKKSIIDMLEEEKERLQSQTERDIMSYKNQYKQKEILLMNKIRDLEQELEIVMERASEEQDEFNNKSEESLKQLKNYYELEKEKL